jgi:iron complex transport system substrate-binding protein
VSAFISANIDRILVLKPDLVLTFSDLQADIVADLIRRGLDVHAFNQRSIAGILDMIRTLGAMVDANERARQLVETLEARLAQARTRAECLPKRPKVFFEEWDDPLISGIGWVSELVEIAGGYDIFADRRNQSAAKDRVVTVEEVVAREPDLIIGSWCGKKFRPERVATRAGFDRIPAVQHQDLYEIKSSLILQPGPAALTDGLAELQRIIGQWAKPAG